MKYFSRIQTVLATLLMALVCFCISTSAKAQDAAQYLILEAANGYTYDVELQAAPSLTFDAGNATVTADGKTIVVEGITKFFFQSTPTAISEAKATTVKIDYTDAACVKVSCPTAMPVKVFAATGANVSSYPASEMTQISLQGLQPGVYLIQVGSGAAFKITKR